MSQLRWDPLLKEWVTYASLRQDRTFLPPAEWCPLCPTKEGRYPTEIPRAQYQIVVFENRFPSYILDAPPPEESGKELRDAKIQDLDKLSGEELKRARHIITENARVLEAIEAL